jgi:TPR repeat protein
MNENNIVFQRNRELFRKNALEIMLKSAEYSDIGNQFDSLLILSDRILSAFVEDVEFNQIRKIAINLMEIERQIERKEDYSKSVEALMQASEQWLKPLLWLVDQPRWEKLNQNKKMFTLFPTIRELGLLTEAELKTSEQEAHKITDEVRLLMYWNRKDRNYTTHETHEAPNYIKGRFLTVALLMLLTPVYKHHASIEARLLGLISSPIPSRDIEDLLALLNSERMKHLDRFNGRKKWIADLIERLHGNPESATPYLLLIGYEGIGKSAISAKLTEELSHNISVFGREASHVRKVAPWLPTVILHFGKQSNHPNEIVRLLIAQANTLLLEPLPLPDPKDYTFGDTEIESMNNSLFPSLEGDRLPEQSSSASEDFKNSTDIYDSQKHQQTERSRRKDAVSDMVRYRRALYLAFEKVAQERGPIVIIIDAIDEISATGRDLDFLPERLPNGVTALLTGRQNTKAVEWISNNREADKLRLTGLEGDEISLLTKIISSDGAAEARFNERVLRVSQGWPVLVLSAARSAQKNKDNLDAVQIDRSVDTVFERQAGEWKLFVPQFDIDILHDLLMLLSVFEPATPLDLGLVQSYLQHKGISVSLIQLRQLLQRIAVQIEGLGAGRIKLSLKAFAEYIRGRYCSRKDLKKVLEAIVDWLCVEDDIDAKTLVSFLEYWLDPTQSSDHNYQPLLEGLIDKIISKRNADFIYDIYLLSRDKKLKKDILLPFASKALFAAAEHGNINAMRVLGGRLIEGVGLDKNVSDGERWLCRAAEKNNTQAMIVLGRYLLDGDVLPKDLRTGESWLRKASDLGDNDATRLLAIRLIDDQCETKNRDEGEGLLRALAMDGDVLANLMLASRLILGQDVHRDLDEGKKILLKLAEDGLPEAAAILGQLILNGNLPPNDSKEGEFWLRKSADAGNNVAGRNLALRLIDGRGLQHDQEEGERLLRKLAEDGDSISMKILGDRLIEGNGLTQAPKEGTHWLRQAGDAGNSKAITDLGLRLFDGQELTQNKQEGLKLLRKAAELGETAAMRLLGDRLLDERGLSKNHIEGKQWLYKAAESENILAMLSLGDRLLKGQGLKKNIKEGEQWLRKAAETHDPKALVKYARELTLGDSIPHDIEKAESLLQEAIAAKSPYGHELLGYLRYGSGYMLEAASYFLKAIELGSSGAKVNLAYMVRRNEIESTLDVPPLKELLSKSVEQKNSVGIINYSLCLAAGTQCDQDWIAADQLLASLANIGNLNDATEWWHSRIIKDNDPEGHLVMGWLSRHHLAKDPDGLTVADRMNRAREGGWVIPEWMNIVV